MTTYSASHIDDVNVISTLTVYLGNVALLSVGPLNGERHYTTFDSRLDWDRFVARANQAWNNQASEDTPS